ncbi:NAD(P)H-dependent flavin oxidoreductase [Bacillus sp. T3]|uniref:NAD(P)H-dependent flavin oxidoreductase n=1 Tax=Bacillus sp. T3 TaxID=467262 RepID=UPI0029813FF9|nr:nitronate monooxygenase [Bacillus sp. T3]
MIENELTKLLNIQFPIIQAPMAGGITTSQLVAAVSNGGGLGFIGAGYMSSEQLRDQIREVKRLTSHPFGVNLFVPNDFKVSENDVNHSNKLLQPIRNQLGLAETKNYNLPNQESSLAEFAEQIKVLLEENIPVCSFTFGLPSPEMIEILKAKNVRLIGTATTVQEAIAIEKIGMDFVVVQGSEAGGHRGNFIKGEEESLVGLMSLIPQVVDNVGLPVIAAGGIADGRGLLAAFCLGAQAVQIGTAFLTCIESGAHPVYKKAIVKAHEDEMVLTRAFSGKCARGINNKFIEEMREHEPFLPEFPVQNSLTQDIRKKASAENNTQYMSLWSGQSPRLAKMQTVQSLIQQIMGDVEITRRKF